MNIHILFTSYFIALTLLVLLTCYMWWNLLKSGRTPEKINIKIDWTHLVGLSLYIYSIWETFIH